MNNRQFFKKTVAWALIAALVNPAAMTPAFARDTDIFLSVTSGASTAEPNILVILDTSDSMNIYEAWREYPGAYDSHVEYLWNDINIISNAEQTTQSSTKISTAAMPSAPTSPYGFWAGATLPERQALWNAAKAYANATETGDPGPRNTYRNYSDAAWQYWLPAGTADTDARLRSPSFNRWRGNINIAGGLRGGITFTGSTDYRGNNKCKDSGTNPTTDLGGGIFGTGISVSFDPVDPTLPQGLTPSTVFAPSAAIRNSGRYLNKAWQRWEPYLDLRNGRFANGDTTYPDVLGATTVPAAGTNSIAAGSGTGTVGSNIRGRNEFIVDPVAAGAVRDSWPRTPNFSSSTDIGDRGQPIRNRIDGGTIGTVEGGDSRSGWTNPKADLGGFNFAENVNNYNSTVLINTLATYGITATAAQSKHRAWKGNRDATGPAPTYDVTVGTPAYFDDPGVIGDINSGSNTINLTGSVNAFAVGNIINIPGAGLAGATLVATITGLSNNFITFGGPAASTTSNNAKITRNLRLNTGGGTLQCTRTCTLDADPGVGGNQAAFAATTNPDGTNTNRFYAKSGATCVSTATAGADCAGYPPAACGGPGSGSNYVNAAYSGSAWSGRQSLVVEGVGTYWYGGTCGAASTCRGSGFVAGGADCPVKTPTTITYGTSSYVRYNYSSTSGLTNITIGGQDLAGARLNDQFGGCGNAGNSSQNAPTREGLPGSFYGPSCSNTQSFSGSSTTDYAVFNNVARTNELAHDCSTDDTTTGNPGSSYLNGRTDRTFGAAWNTTVSTGGNNSAAYTSSVGQAVSGAPAIDTYSVNWLNWKFGPKGPNGYPIGRKTRLQIAKDALSGLVATTDGVRFGLMVFNRTKASPVENEGANIAKRILRMGSDAADLPDYNNRATLNTAINAVVAAARTPLTESLYEAYRYFSGRTPVWGTATNAAFNPPGGTVAQGRDTSAVCTAVGGDCTAIGNYRSPMMSNPDTVTPAGCQKNFVILITDGGPEDDWGANTDIKSMSYAGTLGTVSPKTSVDAAEPDTPTDQFEQTGVRYGPVDLAGTANDGGYVWLDELAYFMSKADISPGARNFAAETDADLIGGRQSVITYTIGFAGASSPVLSNASAKSGGVHYDANDSAALSAALTAAIVAIREWNPTVAAPTVPISALNRAESENDVYLAFFQPDPSQTWLGTVKRFQIGITETDCGTGITLCLIGQTVLASGNKNIEKIEFDPVFGTTNIIVDPDAVSFWNPLTEKDGGNPVKGGTGYQLINTAGYDPSTRNVYTYLSATTTQLGLAHVDNAFKADNTAITKTLLGNPGMTDGTREQLINYMRGGDPSNPACIDGVTGTLCTIWRAWSHFDVQHSKPAIVTYDATVSPVVQYMFYISNNGMLHAIDTDTGKEKWAFVVEEALLKISPLLADVAGQQLDIADGSPVVHVEDTDGNGVIGPGERAWLFFGLRRGGRIMYALDITSQDAPVFKWKISNTTVCDPSCAASAVYSELGQTWSAPTVGRIRSIPITVPATPALIFGGGYDPNQDNSPVTVTDTMGRAVFVVNSDTGVLIKKFDNGNVTGGMKFSIPSDVAALNTDLDAQNFLDRVYVGDTGGNVYRFDINNTAPASWAGKKLAALSNLPDTDFGERKRKILWPPVAVKYNVPFAPLRFDGVFVGTGDREHPLLTSTTPVVAPEDKIVMIKDTAYGLTMNGDAAYQYPGDFVVIPNTQTAGATSAQIGDPAVHGWARGLEDGEKVVSSPTVFFYKLRFGTYAPKAQTNACSPPGEGRLNQLDALWGTIEDTSGDGTTTAEDRWYSGFVTRGYVSTGQLIVIGQNVYYITVSDARLQSILVGTVGVGTRIYWYMEPEQ